MLPLKFKEQEGSLKSKRDQMLSWNKKLINYNT